VAGTGIAGDCLPDDFPCSKYLFSETCMTKFSITIDGYTFDVDLESLPGDPSQALVRINGQLIQVALPDRGRAANDMGWFIVDDRPYEVMIDPEMKWVRSNLGISSLEIQDLDMPQRRLPTGDGRIKAPIPGTISQVMVAIGDEVEAGQALLVLEAMKMENEIRAPRAGVVKLLNVNPGQRVTLNDLLAEIED